MATAIRIPAVGTTVNEVTLLKWRKNAGEEIKRGDILCEIETDKATVELESVAEGILLKQIVSADTQVNEGTIIAWIGSADEEVPDEYAPQRKMEYESIPVVIDQTPLSQDALKEKEKISPLIRNLAQKMGVDVEKITGTGPGGKITREDILRAKESFQE